MFPFLPAVALAALFMGMLNVHEEFGIPALAPVVFNIVSILFGLTLFFAGVNPKIAVIGWSVGTLCGGLAQAGIQVPKLLRLGWRWKPHISGWRKDSGLRQIAILMAPAIVANSALQVNILANSIFASLLVEGSPSWLNYAFRFMQLPIGVFGVAIAIVTMQMVSRDAARNEKESFRNNLASSINFLMVLTIPCAMGLWILNKPIIRLIFERGAFETPDTIATASALSCYAVGLPAYAAVKVLAPAFFALKDSRSPMIASFVAVAVNIAINFTVYQTMGFRGLALGTSAAMITNLLLLMFWFERKHMRLPYGMFTFRAIRILFATCFMAVITFGLYRAIHVRTSGFTGSLLETFLPILAAVFVYFSVLRMLRVPEADMMIDLGKKLYLRAFSR